MKLVNGLTGIIALKKANNDIKIVLPTEVCAQKVDYAEFMNKMRKNYIEILLKRTDFLEEEINHLKIEQLRTLIDRYVVDFDSADTVYTPEDFK